MYIWINILDQKSTYLEVTRDEKIRSIKEKIHSIEKIPVESEFLLTYYGRVLDDESRLVDNNIEREQRIDLILKNAQIICRRSIDSMVSVNVNLTERVDHLKRLLTKQIGKESEYDLYFNQKLLDEKERLIDYGINQDSILDLHFNTTSSLKVTIRILNGKTIELTDLKITDKVEVLKRIIEKNEELSSDRQRLIFNNRQLVDSHTLAHYDIKDRSTIYLHLVFNDTQLAIQMVNSTIMILEVDINDIVETVKSKLEQRLNYPMDQQILVFGKKHLEDRFTLADYKVLNRSVIYLCFKSIEINCNISHDKTIKLRVELNDTVRDVKYRIQDQEPTMLIDKLILSYQNKLLKDKSMLFDFGCTNGSTLDLFFKTIQIFYKLPDAKTQAIDVESMDTFDAIRKRIEEQENIKRDSYYITYAAQILDDSKTPIHYGMRKEATIQLCFRLRGGR